MGRLRFSRKWQVLAAIFTVVSLTLISAVVVLATPLRCGPGRVLGVKGCNTTAATALRSSSTPSSNPIPFSKPFPVGNPASGAYPPYGNPASGAYPPVVYPASGSYPQGNASSGSVPFYPPASNGSPTTVVSLDCRLPVYAGPPGSGGFIAFPGGTFIADPRSSVTLPGSATPPPGPGYGYGPSGLSYDRQLSRWLPVSSNWVAPDGNHYAYVASDGIYAVKVADGTQTELREGHWSIVGVQNDGVYISDSNIGGLWFVPFSGAARQITSSGYWQDATSTSAFGTATSAVPQGVTNTILRLDLRTGTTTDWFTRPGAQSFVIGFDGQGHPIITARYLNNSGVEILIASGPNSAVVITGMQFNQGFNMVGTPVADTHGVWLTGSWSGFNGFSTGVALYVPGSGIYWMSGIGGQLAGGCY